MILLEKLRNWLLVKIAAGKPVALNLKLTRGMYFQCGTINGLFVNIHIDYCAEWPVGPDQVGFYFSGDPTKKASHTYPGTKK